MKTTLQKKLQTQHKLLISHRQEQHLTRKDLRKIWKVWKSTPKQRHTACYELSNKRLAISRVKGGAIHPTP